MPKQAPGGSIAKPIEYKVVNYPKTIYDPSVISDAQISTWGREAMQNGVINQVNGLLLDMHLMD